MAYSELIKNLDTLRTYIRFFYIYGFKSRDKFTAKSKRTYDDEKRRLENYLEGYMTFRPDDGDKVNFVSIDSRHTVHNPLYKLFKAKSFTAMDISLHFMVMDILARGEKKSLNQILDEINLIYLEGFSSDVMPEESTLRKKLKEYEELGLIKSEKNGKSMLYSRTALTDLSSLEDLLNFFSESDPCGVIGSFLFDKLPEQSQSKSEIFQYKHHYISSTIESDFVEQVFCAIREHRYLTIEQVSFFRRQVPAQNSIVPMMIYQSTQGGRMYLMAYCPMGKHFLALRFDYIVGIKPGQVYQDFEQKRAEFEDLRKHIWGVALKAKSYDISTVHVSFRVHFEDDEKFIYQRLEREKRCGTVTLLDKNNAQFDADIFDPIEIIPWIRTFICRITFFDCSDRYIIRRFNSDLRKMKRLYTGEKNAVQ